MVKFENLKACPLLRPTLDFVTGPLCCKEDLGSLCAANSDTASASIALTEPLPSCCWRGSASLTEDEGLNAVLMPVIWQF